jgi:hypothetical protein
MDHYETIIKQNELLHVVPTLSRLTANFRSAPTGSLYFGFGLTAFKAPTIGFPFDALMFILSAEFLRQKFSLGKIHCLIADTHALSNAFCDPNHTRKMLIKYQQTIENIATVTGIELSTHTASSFDQSNEYQQLLDSVDTSKGEYVRRELADILWFHKFHDVKLKLGWLIHTNEKKAGKDECYFDTEFLNKCTSNMSFAYTKSGRTFDENRPYASPYVSISTENRILIDSNTNIQLLFKNFGCSKNKTKHLQSIADLWDTITNKQTDPSIDLSGRIQGIINTILLANN